MRPIMHGLFLAGCCTRAVTHASILQSVTQLTWLEQASLEDTEAEFWRIVEEGEEAVEVLCGVGLDTAVTGSGFPQVCPWLITCATINCERRVLFVPAKVPRLWTQACVRTRFGSVSWPLMTSRRHLAYRPGNLDANQICPAPARASDGHRPL